MQKITTTLVCLFICIITMAQEKISQNELGIVFSNIDNFGLTYKTGSDTALWRFNTVVLSGGTTEYENDDSATKLTGMGVGFRIGKEFRKKIVDNLELRYGVDASFSYSRSTSDIDDITADDNDSRTESTSYRPGINAVFGLNYVLNDHFVIGAEILPGFTYTTGKSVDIVNGSETTSEVSGFNYGLSNNSVLLSLVYRF